MKNLLTYSSPLFLAIILSFSLQSCLMGYKSQYKSCVKQITPENGAYPSDYGEYNGTLLVIISDSDDKKSVAYAKTAEKSFAKYQGDYKLVTEKEFQSDEYEDTEDYRYTFDYNYESHDYSDGGQIGSLNVKRFAIYDRLEKKPYLSPVTGSFYNIIIDAYVNNLNNELK